MASSFFACSGPSVSETFFQLALENVSEEVLFIDLRGIILYLNFAFRRRLPPQYHSDIRGVTLVDLVQDPASFLNAVERTRRLPPHASYGYKCVLSHPEGNVTDERTLRHVILLRGPTEAVCCLFRPLSPAQHPSLSQSPSNMDYHGSDTWPSSPLKRPRSDLAIKGSPELSGVHFSLFLLSTSTLAVFIRLST